jgi:DNA polymerase III sliding clamp (beta) subunit (PCNA family)
MKNQSKKIGEWSFSELKTALQYVVKAAPTPRAKTIRPHLEAICFDGDRVIATDGHRLHTRTLSTSINELIVLNMDVIKVILASSAKIITIYKLGSMVDICLGDQKIQVYPSEGFPSDWENVIPKIFDFKAVLETKVLKAKLTEIKKDMPKHHDRLKLKIEKNLITFFGLTLDDENAIIERPYDSFACETTDLADVFEIGLDIKYLLQALPKDKTVVLNCLNSIDPILLTSQNTTALIMPIRLS